MNQGSKRAKRYGASRVVEEIPLVRKLAVACVIAVLGWVMLEGRAPARQGCGSRRPDRD